MQDGFLNIQATVMRNKHSLAEALASRDGSFGRVYDDARLVPNLMLYEADEFKQVSKSQP